ncbi:MAG: hypothetical protein P8Y36_04060, partial [Alphaproteobacteria bacterium]
FIHIESSAKRDGEPAAASTNTQPRHWRRESMAVPLPEMAPNRGMVVSHMNTSSMVIRDTSFQDQ